MYTGMVDELKPIAMPSTKRPAMSNAVESAKPIVSEPIVKMMLETRMVFLRPVQKAFRLASTSKGIVGLKDSNLKTLHCKFATTYLTSQQCSWRLARTAKHPES